MNRVKRTVLLAACALLVAVPQALAHGGNPNYRSVIRSVTPSTPNVSFQVLNYDSYMQLLDQHGHKVMIYGYSGEPYARILKDGTVQVNERSPATYLNDNRFAEVQVPPKANPKAPPQWKTVDNSGTFIWHDHRMHWMSPATPAKVTDKGRKTQDLRLQDPAPGRWPPRRDKRNALLGRARRHLQDPIPDRGRSHRPPRRSGVLWLRRRRRDEEEQPPDSPTREAW